jgi:hypothetical protein
MGDTANGTWNSSDLGRHIGESLLMATEEHACSEASCPTPGSYYVTAIDGPRFWKMAGPYATHAEALDRIDAARRISCDYDGRAYFMAWGTGRVFHGDTPPGKLNELGLIA